MDRSCGYSGDNLTQRSRRSKKNAPVVESSPSVMDTVLGSLRLIGAIISGNIDRRLLDKAIKAYGEDAGIRDPEEREGQMDKSPLPPYHGVGWCCLFLGFKLPFLWLFAVYLYFKNYHRKDPRERGGIVSSAIAALLYTVLLIALTIIFRSPPWHIPLNFLFR